MLKFFILIASLFFFSQSLFAQMVLKYKITSPNTSITIPLNGTVNVTVDWGDGSVKQKVTTVGSQKHIYVNIGLYTVTISGSLSHFGSEYDFMADGLGPYLLSVENWEGLGLTSLRCAFYQANNLISVPSILPTSITDLSWMFAMASSFNQFIGNWNTEKITNMAGMFDRARSFNKPIGSWNTVNVTDMSDMFRSAGSFNQPIGAWNTSSVINMSEMFLEADGFNQPIGDWNTGNVTDMRSMFRGANSFNQPIGTWNTSKVNDMSTMFRSIYAFNQPIGTWNTSSVRTMSSMFQSSYSFNQPIGTWNTGNVTNMSSMFDGAVSFNQPLGTWDIRKVESMSDMFSGQLCTSNYDNLLTGWAPQEVKSGIYLNGGGSKYSTASESARTNLVRKGWTFRDGGPGVDNSKCSAPASVEVIQNHALNQEIELYPNPSTRWFTVSGKTGLGNISIYNSVGTLVYEINTNASVQNIDFNSNEAGIYLLKIGTKSAKFIKE